MLIRRLLRAPRTLWRVLSPRHSSSMQNPGVQRYVAAARTEYQQLLESQSPNHISRIRQLQPLVELLDQVDAIQKEIQGLLNFKSEVPDQEAELRKEIDEEVGRHNGRIGELELQLEDCLLPTDEQETRDIILEVNGGVGGQEAMLFSAELFSMYQRYAAYRGWQFNILDYHTTDIGGIRQGVAEVCGHNVAKYFQFEAGVHRVQRVPTTEKGGRIHTSTATVAVLPQPDEVEVKLEAKDMEITNTRASGPGGQHVNKSESCVQIRHIPTGMMVESQSSRYQHENKALALKQLRAKLYQKERQQILQQQDTSRRQQVKLGERSDKVRTYNFQQDRVTDHRIHKSVHSLPQFLSGGPLLDQMVASLLEASRKQALAYLLSSQ